MSIGFYDASVASYLQILKGVSTVFSRTEAHAGEGCLEVKDVVAFKLREDMAPFSFQVISLCHHSSSTIEAFKAGLFEPPPRMSGMTWDILKTMVADATEHLESQTADEINALAGKDMIFRIGERELPFTTDNFLLSFSLPNFYFHATTTYAIPRHLGVPLGKMDFLGPLRMNPMPAED